MYLFNVGENIVVNNVKNGDLKINKIKAKFPGRIECEICDFSKMHTRTAGGGGYGFPVDLDNYIQIEISKKDVINASKNKLLILHWIIVMKKALSLEENFYITINYDKFFSAHSGLGSSASTGMIICYLINYMYGSIYKENELIEIISSNYAEQIGDKLTRTPLTGVSLYSIIRGKFVVIDGDMNLICEKSIDERFKCCLINSKVERLLSEQELGLKIRNERIEENINRRELIQNNIVSGLNDNNWIQIFETNSMFQKIGSRKVFIENYHNNGEAIKRIIEYFEKGKNVMVGLTSVGPLVYVLTMNMNTVEEYCRKNDLCYRQTEISKGIKILTKNMEKGEENNGK